MTREEVVGHWLGRLGEENVTVWIRDGTLVHPITTTGLLVLESPVNEEEVVEAVLLYIHRDDVVERSTLWGRACELVSGRRELL